MLISCSAVFAAAKTGDSAAPKIEPRKAPAQTGAAQAKPVKTATADPQGFTNSTSQPPRIAAPPIDNEAAERAEKAFHALNVKYAEAYLRLTKLDLQKAMTTNQKIAALVSDAEVNRLRNAVTIANDRLLQARDLQLGKARNANIATAESSLQEAEDALRNAQRVNQSLRGTVGDIDVERLRMGVELSRLNLAKAHAAFDAHSAIVDIQWQVDEMREEVRRMRGRIEAISARR